MLGLTRNCGQTRSIERETPKLATITGPGWGPAYSSSNQPGWLDPCVTLTSSNLEREREKYYTNLVALDSVLLAKNLEYVEKNESGLILPHFFVEPITNQPFAGVAHKEPEKFSGLRPVKSNERKGCYVKNYIII